MQREIVVADAIQFPGEVRMTKKDGQEKDRKSLLVGVALAIFAASASYLFGVIDDHRKKKIDFVDQQIENLYGPLYALSTAAASAHRELLSPISAKINHADAGALSKPQVDAWRHTMKTVLQPMNVRMANAIVSNSQLIEGGAIYPVFDRFILHVEAYRATIAKWKDADAESGESYLDRSANGSKVAFPDAFDVCVRKMYDALLQRRNDLRASWLALEWTPHSVTIADECQGKTGA